MKSAIKFFICFLLVILSLDSCEKYEADKRRENSAELIIGNWKLVKSIIIYNDMTEECNEYNTGDYYIYSFSSDGVLIERFSILGHEYFEKYKYELVDNMLYLEEENGTMNVYDVNELTKSSLTLHGKGFNNSEFTDFYKKI